MPYTFNPFTGNLDYYESGAETDPIVGAITGIIKADGAGNISAATDGTDYLSPTTGLRLDQTTPQSVINGAPVFDAIDFDTSPSLNTPTEGRLQWNSTDGTLNLGMAGGDVTQQIGQELFIKCWNATGQVIPNGTVVYFDGRQGNRPKIVPAQGNAEATSKVMGVTTQEFAAAGDGREGFITTFGYVRQIKTDYTDWDEGDILYLSTTTAGGMTVEQPDAPHHSDIIGTVGVVGGDGIGSIFVNIDRHKTIEELSDVDGVPFDTCGQTLVWNDDEGYFSASNAYPTSGHYTGFPNRADTSISWDDESYTLTLTASNDSIWINGCEYFIDTLTKALSVAQEAVTGLYWFWIENVNGTPTLTCSAEAADRFDKCLVATVYWNTTTSKGILSDERHWFGRDKWMHEYLHETVGARYADGLAGTFTDTTFEIGTGEFYDEDLEHPITVAQTTAKILYHNGDATWAWDELTTPYKVVNPGVDSNLRYNNGNNLATVDNNKYMNQWVFITGDETHPVHIVIGTAQYTTIALARAATVPSLGSLASAETKLIYKITYQNNGGTPDYIEATDYRSSSNLPIANYVATDHGSLAGLGDDDHPQYQTVATEYNQANNFLLMGA